MVTSSRDQKSSAERCQIGRPSSETNGFFSWPQSLTLDNYRNAWEQGDISRKYWNTVVILVPALLLSRRDSLPGNRFVRCAFFVLCGWSLMAWVTGTDPRGSLIGVYQYRQGLLTFLCYAVLFLAGSNLARRPVS